VNRWKSTLNLHVDQHAALETAAARLRAEFDGVCDADTVDRFLHGSYEQVAAHGTVTQFLPLLAERHARERLRDHARPDGP
jgi:arsenate reductase